DYPIAEKSKFERELIDMCRAERANHDNKTDEERSRTVHCVLHRELTQREEGRRGKRLRQLREEWKDVLEERNPGSESSARGEPPRVIRGLYISAAMHVVRLS